MISTRAAPVRSDVFLTRSSTSRQFIDTRGVQRGRTVVQWDIDHGVLLSRTGGAARIQRPLNNSARRLHADGVTHRNSQPGRSTSSRTPSVSRHLVSPAQRKEMQMNHGIKTIIVPVKDLAASQGPVHRAARRRALRRRSLLRRLPPRRAGDRPRPEWPQQRADRTHRLLARRRHRGIAEGAARRGGPGGAGGQRRRRRQADRVGPRYRWQRHRAAAGSSAMTTAAISTQTEVRLMMSSGKPPAASRRGCA